MATNTNFDLNPAKSCPIHAKNTSLTSPRHGAFGQQEVVHMHCIYYPKPKYQSFMKFHHKFTHTGAKLKI